MARKPADEQIYWDTKLRTCIFEPILRDFGCADDWTGDFPSEDDPIKWSICQDEILYKLKKILDPKNIGKPVITKKKIQQQLRWALTTQEFVKANHQATLDPCKELAVKMGLIREGGPMDFRYKDRPEIKSKHPHLDE